MVDHIVDASERRGRSDIRAGVGRRRRWGDAAKGQVVAESMSLALWCRRWRDGTTSRHSIYLHGARPRVLAVCSRCHGVADVRAGP
jgi:hypothetical protein